MAKFTRGSAAIAVFNVSSKPFYLDGFSAVAEVVPTDPNTPLSSSLEAEEANVLWLTPEEDTGHCEIEYDFGVACDQPNFSDFDPPDLEESEQEDSEWEGSTQLPPPFPPRVSTGDMEIKTDKNVKNEADFRLRPETGHVPGMFVQ